MTAANRNSPQPTTRTLRLTGMAGTDCEARIADVLGSIDGIMEVKAIAIRNRVTVTYDLRRVRLPMIEAALADLGYPLVRGWLARMLRAWNHFSEDNTTDALNLEPHCCNKAPAPNGGRNRAS